ncbi:MAG: hypothetical protein ACPLPT_00875 [Moorellales bacterium]
MNEVITVSRLVGYLLLALVGAATLIALYRGVVKPLLSPLFRSRG